MGKRDLDGYEVMTQRSGLAMALTRETRHLTRSMTQAAADARHEARLSCIGANRSALDRIDALTTGGNGFGDRFELSAS